MLFFPSNDIISCVAWYISMTGIGRRGRAFIRLRSQVRSPPLVLVRFCHMKVFARSIIPGEFGHKRTTRDFKTFGSVVWPVYPSSRSRRRPRFQTGWGPPVVLESEH